MKKVTLFDESLYAVDYDKHSETKKKFLDIVDDLQRSSMNVNAGHHTLVHQTPPGLQVNNAFHHLVTCTGIQNFSKQKRHDVILPKEKKFAVTSMWASLIPKHGQLLQKEHDGVYYGTYFLHSPPDSGMIIFYNNVSDGWYSKFGNIIHNEHNANTHLLNMPEGGVFIIPSYIKCGTTTNMSDNTNVQINFVIDIVDA